MKIRITIIAACAAAFALAQAAPAQAAQISISNHKPPPGKMANPKASTGTAKQPISDQAAGGVLTKQK